MIPWYVFKKNRTKNTWSLESSVSIILQKIEIAFYCEKYSCPHFDHVIMIQGNRKLKKIDIQTIFFPVTVILLSQTLLNFWPTALKNCIHCVFRLAIVLKHVFFKRKPFFYLSFNFLNIMLEIRLRFLKYFS